jgi:hypothetical protein
MIAFLGIIGQFFSLVPGLTGLGQTWINAHYNAQVQQVMAKLNADRDTAVAVLQMQGEVQSKFWFVAAIPPLFALPFVLWVWKAVVWDKLIMDGATSTDPLNGVLSTAFIMILTFYFAAGMKR